MASNWQLIPPVEPPTWLVDRAGIYAAQLLWQRGWRDRDRVEAFLDCAAYTPTSAVAFGAEMQQAVKRIKQAFERDEKVLIWGDFDADGITATSVLWEGLGQFFPQERRLFYYIPDRLVASHGLSQASIERLHSEHNCQLIITCDTGSTNLDEIIYARSLGIDLIVTDHHTLPAERPPVVAIVNPRYLEPTHPLYHLSGVAVAFKLVEALYEGMPIDRTAVEPLENLLDLVAIGLVADLVQLVGDCRYLAQRGIEILRQKRRPGIKSLLEQCKKAGDRAIDISFGIAPRINSISRIWGDVRKCVELLTSQDPEICQELAELAELANTERKALQRRILSQVEQKIDRVDLSTTGILVLDDPQWPVGILGLVAGQVASTYNRPTILCNSEAELARGSARSIAGIDLYELIKGQEHLLASFGGHPLAAGFSLPTVNLSLLREALNHRFWQHNGQMQIHPLEIDLKLTISELGQNLFRQIKLLEPYGMGNPAPRFLISNCRFENIFNANIKTFKGKKVEYIRTEFDLVDRTGRIKGDWWGHYSYELPAGECNAIVELVDNPSKRTYTVRLIDFVELAGDRDNLENSFNLPAYAKTIATHLSIREAITHQVKILDWRGKSQTDSIDSIDMSIDMSEVVICDRCPTSWREIEYWLGRASSHHKPLVLTYSPPEQSNGTKAWRLLVGIAKYLSRTGKAISRSQLRSQLHLEDAALQLGLDAIAAYGWQIAPDRQTNPSLQMQFVDTAATSQETAICATQKFINAVNELSFQQRYFDRQLLSLIAVYAITGEQCH
ncbi:single-stranded-DNA-specific exonuclease RecJ [Pseudanabaena sp. PCC 6802]|uniref:single-stranded-DNA-specific exonuclease RecJ n=1 Tax=Pseudanabaena sp. PCC 6802 TaxID=118173 RepID=UPI0003477B14|nr:single-stranded-DNA-specific exonuclease RecJ [Pseudanabaena sp. PCC 6802]